MNDCKNGSTPADGKALGLKKTETEMNRSI